MTRSRTARILADRPAAVLMGWPGGTGNTGYRPTSPPGVIGGAIICAARRSAHLTTRRLARSLDVDPVTVRCWQNGASPLFCLPHGQLRQLAAALRSAGAQVGRDLGELLLASRCDLLITGMLRGFEDYAEVPPIDEDGREADAARAMFRWAITGIVPELYRPYAWPVPLMSRPDMERLSSLAQVLKAGNGGPDLVPFGAALMALTQR
jgi:hypothetical protein